MHAYFDTGVLVPLYVPESFSDTMTAYLESHGEAIPLSLFQRLELENAFRLKAFRGEIEADRCLAILQKIESTANDGFLVLRPANWVKAFDKARSIGERVTAKTGCRTLDLIHVAIAVQWGCSIFVSADERQLAAAKAEGLRVVDVRDLHRRRGGGRTEPGAVREAHAHYGSKKRVSRRLRQ